MPAPQDPRRLPRWPADPSLLTNTAACPACFAALHGMICHNCGLDLGVPAALELLAAGNDVVTAETKRQHLITRMRVEQEQRSVPAQPAPLFTFVSGRSVEPAGPLPPVAAASPMDETVGGTPPPDAAQTVQRQPRRSGIQILMLTVGVILVSIMALFFVLLAYLVASLEVRSVLTGLGSVGVFGIAVLLSRRQLRGTAEGITALAVVLFLLDLWIVRANGLFGSDRLDGWLYTGLSLGLLSGLLLLASRALPLRTLSLSAVLLGPIAGFALVHGLLADVDGWTRAWAALTTVGLAALLWIRIPRSVERAILRSAGMLATAGSAVCAFGAFPDLRLGGTIAFSVVAATWFCTLAIPTLTAPRHHIEAIPEVRPRRGDWGTLAAIGLGLAAAGSGLSLVLREGVQDAILWMPATVIAFAAVVVASLSRIPRLAGLRSELRLAALIPLGLAGLAAAPAFWNSVVSSTWGATTPPFSLPAFGSPSPPLPLDADAPLALLLVSGLGLAALAALNLARHTLWLPAAVGGFGLTAAGAVIGQPVTSAAFLGVLATGLLIAVARVRSRALRGSFGAVFVVTLFAFGTIGLASTATFPVTTVATVILLAALRHVVVGTLPPSVVPGLTSVATGSGVIAVIVSARLVPDWFEAVTGTPAAAEAPILWMTIVALLLILAALFASDLSTRAENAATSVIAAVATGIGVTELADLSSTISLIASLALTAVVGLSWQLRRRVSGWPERYAAAAVTPAAILWAVGVSWGEFGPNVGSGFGPDVTTSVTLAGATVVLAAGAPLLFPRRDGMPGTHSARIAWDVALAATAVILIASIAARPELGWLTLVLLAASALLVASGNGGIFVGQSPRRLVAWLGLPLAVAGLWLGLARADARIVEFYTLPVAGLLLAILWLTVLRRPTAGTSTLPGRTILLASAVIVGLGPSAIAAAAGEPLRALLVLVVAGALIGVGSVVPAVSGGLRVGVVLWVAGAGAVAIVGVGRTWLDPTSSGTPFEWWSGGASLLLLIAGALWLWRSRSPAWLATGAIVTSALVVSLATTSVILTVGVDQWRAVTVLLVTCGFIVAASVRDELSPPLRWVSVVSGVILSGTMLATRTADPFELATVPLAAALLIGGSIRLTRVASRRSWLELGPGLALLLVPSLAADLTTTELWRVVTLGIVALAVLAAGLVLKLQAPTLIGAAVVTLHGLAQLWPWISGLYGSVPWWLWAGIGGVILIVFAATYESRIRNLKAVARGLSSLR